MDKTKLLENLSRFIGTESYHRNFLGINYTDGVQYLACEADCYWLIDLVASYQSDHRVKNERSQVYELEVNEDKSAFIKIRNRENKILAKQFIDFTDFPLRKFTLMFEDNVLFLPSES